MQFLKKFIKRLFRSMGLDLSYYSIASSSDAQFMAMLMEHEVNCVFDVGANVGQFGRQLRNIGYKGRIVSFEPMSAARQQLLVASKKDCLWDIAPQAAIGNQDSEIEINISGNSVSSSVLNMLDSHVKSAPQSVYIGSEKVPLRRLDKIAQDYVQSDDVLFIKIDTQGYEDMVIEGAPNILAKAIGVQMELSLSPLYEGQKLYMEMIDKLKELGFELWSIAPAFVEPNTGRFLQIDASFFRKRSDNQLKSNIKNESASGVK
jgi:FkbM family methyltransferase